MEARWPELAGCDAVLDVERVVRHRGPGAARSLWLACLVLEWEPVWRGPVRRRFWGLPLRERAQAARRWESSRLGFRRASWRLLEEALGDRPPDQPPSGA